MNIGVALCYGFLKQNACECICELIAVPVVLASHPSKSIFIHRPLSQYCGLILTCRATIGCGNFVIFPSSTYFPWSSFKWYWNVRKINVDIEYLIGQIRGGSDKGYVPNVWVHLILRSLATSMSLQLPPVSFKLLKHTYFLTVLRRKMPYDGNLMKGKFYGTESRCL